MVVGNKKCSEIKILTDENKLIASITDEDIIEKSGYKVVCVPVKN